VQVVGASDEGAASTERTDATIGEEEARAVGRRREENEDEE